MQYHKLRCLAGILIMSFASPAWSSEVFVQQARAGRIQGALGAAKAIASQSLSVPISLASVASTLPQTMPDNRYVPGNASYVMQNGTSNTAVIMQAGNQNLSAIVQQGQRNSASVAQSSGTR